MINSRLRVGRERPDPVKLAANSGLCFQGSNFTEDLRFFLVSEDSEAGLPTTALLGGRELVTSPTQAPERLVIDFEGLSREEITSHWPETIARLTHKPGYYKVRESRGFYDLIKDWPGAVACSGVGKHIIFVQVPNGLIFSVRLFIHHPKHFAALTSRLFLAWVKETGSTLNEGISYTTECFNTFPFPDLNPTLAEIGQRLDSQRKQICAERQIGLTKLYNLLKDPRCTDTEIQQLRQTHLEIDQAVLAAYGWSDLEFPPYDQPLSDEFENELLDRLFSLNAERALDANRERGKMIP